MLDANSRTLLDDVTQFIYREARLQDDHEYEAWEALWTSDGVYWIPAGGEGSDPERDMSIVYDNRSRISLRVKQLLTGRRLSQTPRSRIRRIVSNIEILDRDDRNIRVTSNAMVFESQTRGETIWASRNEYVLRHEAGGLRMAFKKVVLVNNDQPLFSMAFLI
jgi:3-phenylpropionate/cinnamic acid dioxygenase small subunit